MDLYTELVLSSFKSVLILSGVQIRGRPHRLTLIAESGRVIFRDRPASIECDQLTLDPCDTAIATLDSSALRTLLNSHMTSSDTSSTYLQSQ